jgi:hypothetical protein
MSSSGKASMGRGLEGKLGAADRAGDDGVGVVEDTRPF